MTDNQLFTPGYSLLFMVVKVYLNTVGECKCFNACHAIGDSDRGKAGATKERTITNARHAIGEGD